MILASVISFSCGSQDVINTNPLRKLTHIKCELWSDIQGIIYLWSLQRKSLWKLLLIAATLQAQWAITPCCTDLLLPSGQMERQIVGKRGTTSGYVGLHVLWGVVDSEARWKHQLDLSWAAQLSAEGNLTELISRRHLHSSPTLISHFHFLSLSLSSAYQYIVKPSISPSILKIVTLQCKRAVYMPPAELGQTRERLPCGEQVIQVTTTHSFHLSGPVLPVMFWFFSLQGAS